MSMNLSVNSQPRRWLKISSRSGITARIGVQHPGTVVIECDDIELKSALTQLAEYVMRYGVEAGSTEEVIIDGDLLLTRVIRRVYPTDPKFLESLRGFDTSLVSSKLDELGVILLYAPIEQ